ncbi:hypothetical protein AAFC00_004463 [Neodothiora populina]|uniref:Uncharacterized protein n=1 Tax=Neodothiora populina TaxID=2781224 RepID=A0ABR3P3G3_9PEZI
MSQPEATTEGSRRSTRNPRRRQRPESDSLPTQPRRKRSKISTDTFHAPSDHKSQDEAPSTAAPRAAKMNGNAAAAAAAAAAARGGTANGHVRQSSTSSRRASVVPLEKDQQQHMAELVVRGAKKAAPKRAARSDGSTILAQNDHYSVRHLPSTPDILRNSASDYRGSILQSPPLALAITHERAYIWDYTSSTPVTHPRTFDVAQPTKSSDPLPIGALVTNSNTRAIGLLIVSAATGNMTYWENIETAESLSLFQHRNTGIQGNLGGLFGGESAIDMTSADHAGFIVTLSSGRIAHISLADARGKPKIAATFLRSNDAAGSGGIFGSIKSTFGLGVWKRDIVSVHTRPVNNKREIQVIAGTENAQIQIWDLAWSGQSVYKGSFDFREILQREITHFASSSLPVRERSVKVLDVAITPTHTRGDELSLPKADTPLDLMLLVQTIQRPDLGPSSTIANVVMSGSNARLEQLIPIRLETAIAPAHTRPRLLVPKPGHTAYIVSQNQIVFASVTMPPDDGPEAQLMAESQSELALFQDAIWLRSGKHLAIEGCCEESLADSRGSSACAIFVKGYGLARVTANEPAGNPRSRPSMKSKIEQAIFYGTMSDNIFDLSRKAKLGDQYDIEDVELAALRISNEILCSTNPYLPAPLPTTEAHLSARARASQALIIFLRTHYPGMSKVTSWRLMADAEKLAAAYSIWTTYDEKLSAANKDSPKPVMLPLGIKALEMKEPHSRSGKTASAKTAPPQQETDPVRQWFINDVANMGRLRTTVLLGVIGMYEGGKHKDLMKIISEADDIIFGIYDAVFAFRRDNAELYGFSYALLSEGILEEGWDELPEPWTSTHDVFNAYNKFIDVARDFSGHTYVKDEKNPFVQKVVLENVKLVTILCLLYRERIAYISVHYGERGPQYPENFAEAFTAARAHHLRSLGEIGQDGAGIAVAEKYHDLQTMVKLVIGQSEFLRTELEKSKADEFQTGLIKAKRDELETTIQRYFKDIGEGWANAFFDAHLHEHHSYGLLREAEKYQNDLTKYLRADPSRGRLGWIHDILREQDFTEASKALGELARGQESKLWNKKIELSLGKLSALAVKEEAKEKKSDSTTVKHELARQESDLNIVSIQEEVKDSFEPILFAAVDTEAEVQLVSDAYALTLKRRLPSFHQSMEIAFEDMLKNIVLSAERLIDVLTLMDPHPPETAESELSDSQFYLALQVLSSSKKELPADQFDMLQKLIWKRCWLSDDWELINNTKRKSDKFVTERVRESMVCKTYALGLKNSLFTPQTGLTFLDPSHTLGAATTKPELTHRYHVDDLIDPLLIDYRLQDSELQEMMEKCRLVHWWGIIAEEGKKVVEDEAQAQRREEGWGADLEGRLRDEEGRGGAVEVDGGVVDEVDGVVVGDAQGQEEEEGEEQVNGHVVTDGAEDADVDME